MYVAVQSKDKDIILLTRTCDIHVYSFAHSYIFSQKGEGAGSIHHSK